MFEQITEQPLISELDGEHPEQIPPRKPQFVTRLTQITSKSQTSPEKSPSKDSLGMTRDLSQELFDHSTILELRVINQIPATIRPSDALNQEYQPTPHSYQGISTANLIVETEDYPLADQYSYSGKILPLILPDLYSVIPVMYPYVYKHSPYKHSAI